MRRTPLLIILLLLLAATLANSDQRGTATLSVTITAINPDAGGNLRVALFGSEQGWPKFQNSLQTQIHPATSSELQVQFTGLPYADNYAVEVHHDANGNGKFDMRWFPYPRPKEGVGVSNDTLGFGPPDFNAARFSIDKPHTLLEIPLHY